MTRVSIVRRVVQIVVIAAWMGFGASAPRAQDTTPDVTLTIVGNVPMPLTLSISEFKAMPRVSVTVGDNGREITYEGVLVGELLKRAGASLGRDLSGPALATYVVASAKDGYEAVFSLAELDPALTANDIMVADTINGKPLSDTQGPIRIVAPHDKRGARSVRMLQRLEVVRLRK
jgi:DMSO/TMAO reductase YedYZ molybdopterin-dependent catalytic subunit